VSLGEAELLRLDLLERRQSELVSEMRAEILRISTRDDLDQDEKKAILDRLWMIFPQQFNTLPMISMMKSGNGESYVASISQIIRIKKLLNRNGFSLAPGGNDKARDLAFGRRNGVKVPDVYQENVTLGELSLIPETIVKPTSGAGSRGVVVVQSDLRIRSIRTGAIYQNLEGAMLGERVKSSRFRVEELVQLHGEAASDQKCYSFYGQLALVLEMRRANGKKQYCWYDGAGKMIDPESVMGKRASLSFFEGDGVSDEVIRSQQVLSLASPVPFLRIDFLKGDSGSYLGEITPHPGRYREGLTGRIDHELGIEFEKAWARLLMDLLGGKSFASYFETYS